MPDNLSTDYINSTDYQVLEPKVKQLKTVIDDLSSKSQASRKLRYDEVDIEAEREAQRLQPDELYIPQHIIDTNIRREQSAYVQYITQSPRAVICKDIADKAADLSMLDNDLTDRLRFDGWQLSQFANIDSFEANGYSIMEVIQDLDAPGGVAHESVQLGDFAYIMDTKDIQNVEMTCRAYYFTRTKLLQLCGDGSEPTHWSSEQVRRVISKEPESNHDIESSDYKDRSLYQVLKVMFRVNGFVNVAWTCPDTCTDWLRNPIPLFLGRRQLTQQSGTMGILQKLKSAITPNALPPSTEEYEKDYPYILFPYLISENDTISQLKGRVFLDQDLQEAVSSLMSSAVTQARRAAGLYFSKEVSDPNDDILMQKNIFFRSGCLINSKVSQFQLAPPDPSMFSAIQTLVSANQNETSQVNFAANNRKDSRKTAKEIDASLQQQALLSTVQVVLFSIALTQLYRLMSSIIKSRVLAGLIVVPPDLMAHYQRNFTVKPSGDTDVIEKQQTIGKLMQLLPTVQGTPAAPLMLIDLLELSFPDRAQKYVFAIQQGMQQAQAQQTQEMQTILNMSASLAKGVIALSKEKDMFSEKGQLHALPRLEMAAQQLEEFQDKLPKPTSSNHANVQQNTARM